MALPDDIRDEHCKQVLRRFELVTDRFRNTATMTAVGALAFFVVFFVPFVKLSHIAPELRKTRYLLEFLHRIPV